MLDKTVSPADATQIRNAITSAAGIQRQRGDTLTVSQVTFPKPVTPAKPGAAAAIKDYLGYILAGLALIVLLVAVLQLRRRESETLMREPRWLREIEAPTTLAALEAPGGSVLPARAESPTRLQLEELAEREPERAAQQIRTWMRDD